MAAKTFIFREEWLDLMQDLPVAQQNLVIRAAIDYAFTGADSKLSMPGRAIFRCIKGSIDRAQEKYEARAARNRENGSRGGRPKKQNENPVGFFGFQQETQNNPNNPLGFINTGKMDENSQKKPTETQNNPENPDGFFGFTVKTQKNPILIPLSFILNPLSFFLIPYPDGMTEEEKEQQRIYEYFFIRNYLHPHTEAEKIISWNAINGKKDWASMTADEKSACLNLWKPEEERQAAKKGDAAVPKRFPDWFRDSWLKIYIELGLSGCPAKILRDMMSDGITWKKDGSMLEISCSQDVAYYIERNAMEQCRPHLKEMVASIGAECVRWQF